MRYEGPLILKKERQRRTSVTTGQRPGDSGDGVLHAREGRKGDDYGEQAKDKKVTKNLPSQTAVE